MISFGSLKPPTRFHTNYLPTKTIESSPTTTAFVGTTESNVSTDTATGAEDVIVVNVAINSLTG
ncbi:hypothetical protein CROQUDRAFT_103004 [Cronartium quercuum f. sp. fusiforme G11]|uniref:Uncharacterized protein n=1 Tax=Cronartium quercuum f. sp. fusiforme G11 TaxID=708437 RepID=A0A9P6NY36_9BASI|nr:hypothetical protein CROQUDRAFT_103004 [Cronartium quercuum f. sp. fusiforme G11]